MTKNKHAHSFAKPCLWCGEEMLSWTGYCERCYCSNDCKKSMATFRRKLRSIGLDLTFRHYDSRTSGNLIGVIKGAQRAWLTTRL